MTVATFTQPNYLSDMGTSYPLNIDAAIKVLSEMGQDFAPHAAASPNLTVLIDAGKIIKADGTLISQAQQTATFVAPAANPRIDRIVVDMLTGVYSIIAGTEAASPVAPAITAGKLPCAQVSLIVGQTQITNANITDERTAFASAPQITYHTATGTDTYTVSGLTLVSGFDYRITFTNANATTAPTLNGTTIKKEGSAALLAGDIPAGHAGVLRHNGTDLILVNPYKAPLARLSASAANSGYPQSGTGGETLRIIRGQVSAAGTIEYGAGFTVTRDAVGQYTLYWTTAFSAPPSVVGTIAHANAGEFAGDLIPLASSVEVRTYTVGTTTSADKPFTFIAIGPA